MKYVYNYDKNGFYTGKCEADESPLEKGKYLLPAFATFMAPPTCKSDELAVFDESTTSWTRRKNLVGTEYWSESGEKHIITEIGKTVPRWGLTKDPKESEYHEYVDGKWVLNERAQILDELTVLDGLVSRLQEDLIEKTGIKLYGKHLEAYNRKVELRERLLEIGAES